MTTRLRVVCKLVSRLANPIARNTSLGIILLTASLVSACNQTEQATHPSDKPAEAPLSTNEHQDLNTGQEGDPDQGKALVVQFECNRCHDISGIAAAEPDKHCVSCHQRIHADDFDAPPPALGRWQHDIVHLLQIPSLTTIRFHRAWITSYLMKPYDLRPNLAESMPRFPLTESQAADITAYLTHNQPKSSPFQPGNAAHGRELIEAKGCGSCHVFSGVSPLHDRPRGGPSPVALAPDLRHTRDRIPPDTVVRWLLDPKSLKPDTLMPQMPLTEGEARDIATYIITASLAPAVKVERPPRLAVLDRRVSYDEVSEKVFRKTCWHCHSEPDYARGDGGPGNTGGFGFKPRKLNLASYEGILSGALDDHGQRRSIFAPLSDGNPRLLKALLVRQDEEQGNVDAEVHGMPLGLPSLLPEEIQLVESWIAQGRPRD